MCSMAYSIKDVAKEAGVGIGTVSRTLNRSGYVKQSTRERVMAAVEKLNYSPNPVARDLSAKKPSILAVVIPDITNPFFSAIVRGITAQLENSSYTLVLYNTNNSAQTEASILESLQAKDIVGLILVPNEEENAPALAQVEQLQHDGIPVVLLDRYLLGARCDRVLLDNRTGSKEAVCYLLDHNWHHVAIITGSQTTTTGRERMQGWMDAYAAHGLTPAPDLIFSGSFQFEDGFAQTRHILQKREDIDAVFCCNNLMTLGCLRALQADPTARRLAVVGFDTLDHYLSASVSFVCAPATDMSRRALSVLLDRIHEKDAVCQKTTAQELRIQTHLIAPGLRRE